MFHSIVRSGAECNLSLCMFQKRRQRLSKVNFIYASCGPQHPGNAWLNFTCYHPPRATLGTSPALRSRGWGIVWSRLVPGGGGRGKSKITSCCSLRSCAVRHFSVDAGPRGEDCLFPGRISRICSRLVREDNLSKLKLYSKVLLF